MPRHVAFLRAINVGGHTVKMDKLRSLFAALDLRNVETFIASGNVLFDSAVKKLDALETRIERHLNEALGYEVATFVRPYTEIAAIGAFEPPSAVKSDGAVQLYIGFLKTPPGDETRKKLAALANDIDDFHVRGRELYWSSARGFSSATISGAQLERALKMPTTFRNVTTVRRLAAGG